MRILAPEHLSAARALATDAAAAEVVAGWRTAGIESVLLKGPTIAEWLYPQERCGYEDADLLIAPADLLGAAAVLERLGFAPVQRHVSSHAHPWIRSGEGVIVDLHVRLWWGLQEPPERVFRELRRWLETRLIGSVPVDVLNLPARALCVALHAAHDPGRGKPREDLRRALANTSLETWCEAQCLADRIGALLKMADGLQLEPEGERLIAQLPLVRAALLGDRANAPLAVGFARLSLARGHRAKLGVLVRALRTPAGTPPLNRLVSLVVAVPRTLLALRAARRGGGGTHSRRRHRARSGLPSRGVLGGPGRRS